MPTLISRNRNDREARGGRGKYDERGDTCSQRIDQRHDTYHAMISPP